MAFAEVSLTQRAKRHLHPAAILLLGLTAAVATSYFLTDWPAPTAWRDFLGILGSIASFIGILYAVYQVVQIRRESEVIRATSIATRNRVVALEQFGDLSNAIRFVRETQLQVRSKSYLVALMRLQDAKLIVTQIHANETGKATDLEWHILQLNLLIAALEKELGTGANTLDVASFNRSLETMSDRLVLLQANRLKGE